MDAKNRALRLCKLYEAGLERIGHHRQLLSQEYEMLAQTINEINALKKQHSLSLDFKIVRASDVAMDPDFVRAIFRDRGVKLKP